LCSVRNAHLSVFLYFSVHQKKNAARVDKTNAEEETWALSKFYPTLEVSFIIK